MIEPLPYQIEVIKIGGSVLNSVIGFRQMVDIVKLRLHGLQVAAPAGGRLVVVVSAFAKTTRTLETACRLAELGDIQGALSGCSELMLLHRSLVQELMPESAAGEALITLLASVEMEIRQVLRGIATVRQCTPRSLDRVLAMGELLALHISKHVISDSGINAGWADARRFVVTSGTFGAAEPLVEQTGAMVRTHVWPLLQTFDCLVTQGFVGATGDGIVTTMGKESSTLTATLLAELLDATSVTLFTDVNGVRSADPKVVDSTICHHRLSFQQAELAAHHGLKLLYPTTIGPAWRASIPVSIVNAFHPSGESTTISSDGPTRAPIVIIKHVENMLARVTLCLASPREALIVLGQLATEFDTAGTWHVTANPTEPIVSVALPHDQAVSVALRMHEMILSPLRQD